MFSILTQLGVGPSKGFMIEDKSATWKDFISDESKYMLVKSYMHLKVKLLFDPPLSSAVLECYKTQISEYEWRLNVAAENDDTDPDEPEHYSGSYDLKKKIERLKLEREFKNLTEDDIAPGRKYVSEILSASGKKALTVAAAGAMTYAVKTAMTKEFNLKEAAQYIAANPNKKK